MDRNRARQHHHLGSMHCGLNSFSLILASRSNWFRTTTLSSYHPSSNMCSQEWVHARVHTHESVTRKDFRTHMRARSYPHAHTDTCTHGCQHSTIVTCEHFVNIFLNRKNYFTIEQLDAIKWLLSFLLIGPTTFLIYINVTVPYDVGVTTCEASRDSPRELFRAGRIVRPNDVFAVNENYTGTIHVIVVEERDEGEQSNDSLGTV